MRWDTVLDVSDYQNVVNIVYVGLLGIEKDISEECESQFHHSYKKELLLYESYQKVEEVILWQLERHGIDAALLLGTSVGEMYPKPEMSHISQIEILVDKKDMPRVNKFMLEMDYEQKVDPVDSGIVYVRVPGVRIVFYNGMPIENKAARQFFPGAPKRFRKLDAYRHIHMLTNEEEYLYRIARMVEMYITGRLKVRDIMDLWQYQKLLGERFRWKSVNEALGRAVWQKFADQINVLAALWFGREANADEQYGLALELEEYILSRGRENKHLDESLLPCEKLRLDFYWRNRDKEWALRKQAWMFPSRDYMVQFFPILERYPFLLFFCWIIRNFRFLRRICISKFKKVGFRIRIKLSDIKDKLKGMIRKGKNEDLPEDSPEEAVQAGEGAEESADTEHGEAAGITEKAKDSVRIERGEESSVLRKAEESADTEHREENRVREKPEEAGEREYAEEPANLKETEGEEDSEELKNQN